MKISTVLYLIAKVLLALIVLLAVVYWCGPRPTLPVFKQPEALNLPDSLLELEQYIINKELNIKGLRKNNEAKIIWADTTKKQKTKIVFLYLHGFGASYMEGSPVNTAVAKEFGCNIFMARLSEHGINAGEDNYLRFTADNYYQSAEEALQIAQQLGDEVIILGTSGGGAMGLFLCSRHPEVKALVTYSPAIRLFDPKAALLNGPWGLQLAHLIIGKQHNDWDMRPGQEKYWTNHQRFEGIIQFALFQEHAMTAATFANVKCPIFLGYYYENEEKQDKVVSVAAMMEMYEQLGTPTDKKRKIDFVKAEDHVLTSDILSKDWQSVEQETERFLKEIVFITK